MSARHAGLLALLAAIWGASYLLIKYALEDFSPAAVVFGRTLIGALVLLALLALRGGVGQALAEIRERPKLAVLLGLVAVTAPFMLITLGELEVPSGLTAVLIAPASLFVALLAPLLDRDEMIGGAQAVGLMLGLVGVALLVGVEFVSSLPELLGAVAILGASLSYALSSFIVKSAYAALPTLAVSFVSIAAGALLTFPAAVVTAPTSVPSLRAVLAVIVLGVGATGVAFVIFYKLIAEIGAGRASLVSYLAPPVSLAYGVLLLSEEITVATVAGLLLILSGVGFAGRRAQAPAPEPAPIRSENA